MSLETPPGPSQIRDCGASSKLERKNNHIPKWAFQGHRGPREALGTALPCHWALGCSNLRLFDCRPANSCCYSFSCSPASQHLLSSPIIKFIQEALLTSTLPERKPFPVTFWAVKNHKPPAFGSAKGWICFDSDCPQCPSCAPAADRQQTAVSMFGHYPFFLLAGVSGSWAPLPLYRKLGPQA